MNVNNNSNAAAAHCINSASDTGHSTVSTDRLAGLFMQSMEQDTAWHDKQAQRAQNMRDAKHHEEAVEEEQQHAANQSSNSK